MQDLAQRYAILDVKEAAPARQWAEQALLDLFGKTRLGSARGRGRPRSPAVDSTPPTATPGTHTVVRVAPPPMAPEEAAARTTGEQRASELVETYAEASAQLGRP